MDCIGVFDSGVGGISVLKALVKELPNENFIYYGDSAHAPYGTKTVEEIQKLSFEITDHLISEGAKAVVVACNSATSAAVRVMREKYKDIPIVGIEPALKPAVKESEGGAVMVLATPMTIREEKFKKLMARFEKDVEILPVSCPGLMEYVEKGVTSGEELQNYFENLLGEYKEKNIGSVVLGCTHYPFLTGALREFFGDKTKFYEGGEGVARETKRRVKEAGLLSTSKEKGKVVFENSGSAKMIALSEKLLNLGGE